MKYRSLEWEDVEEGQALPEIRYELSLLRLVAMVRASGHYDYVHFDRDYARSAGARDAFIATHHVAGLFSRLATDWSGPQADLRSLTWSMSSQSCAGDMLTITGRVGRKYTNDRGEFLVDLVDLTIGHETAPQAASASATLVLPSRTGGPVGISGIPAPRPKAEPDPLMPDFAKSMLGKVREGLREPARPLTEDEIHLWCECVEDWDPLYWDREYAAGSRHGGIIAPPAAIFFGAGSSARVGVGYLKPGEDVPEPVREGLAGVALLQEFRKNLIAAGMPFMPPGLPEVAVVRSRADYFTPLRPGDSTRTQQELLNCSPMKRTRLGEGLFVTWVNSAFNQREELVRAVTLTAFHYRAAQPPA